MPGEVSGFIQDMLAVVEKQERLPCTEMGGQLRRDRNSSREIEPECSGDSIGNERGITQGSQIHPDHAINEARSHVLRNGLTEAGLAHPAGTGQRQERHRFLEQEGARGDAVWFPPDEPGAWSRHIPHQRRRSSRGHGEPSGNDAKPTMAKTV